MDSIDSRRMERYLGAGLDLLQGELRSSVNFASAEGFLLLKNEQLGWVLLVSSVYAEGYLLLKND